LSAPTQAGVQPGFLFRVNDVEGAYLDTPGAVSVPVAAELVQYSTVEKLFAFIRKAWAARPLDPEPGDLMRFNFPRFRIDVQYDAARGYPTRLCVDPDTTVSDNEFGFLITDFKVLSKAALRERNVGSASTGMCRPDDPARARDSPFSVDPTDAPYAVYDAP
jgi:hypothetical protein